MGKKILKFSQEVINRLTTKYPFESHPDTTKQEHERIQRKIKDNSNKIEWGYIEGIGKVRQVDKEESQLMHNLLDFYANPDDNNELNELGRNRNYVVNIISEYVPKIKDYKAENETLIDHLTWFCYELTSVKRLSNGFEEKIKKRRTKLKAIVKDGALSPNDDFLKHVENELKEVNKLIDSTKEQFKVLYLNELIKVIDSEMSQRTKMVAISCILHDLDIYDKSPFPNLTEKLEEEVWLRMKNYSEMID